MPDPTSQRLRQTFEIGTTAEFRIPILNSAGAPVELLDNSLYPSYAFISPSGVQVQTGVATQDGPPGHYLVQWSIPLQAELSNDDRSWQLIVNVVTKRRNQVEKTWDFNIVNKQLTGSGRRTVTDISLSGKPYRAIWRGDFDPAELSLECYASKSPEDIAQAPLAVAVTKASMQKIIDGDSIAYYYDIPATNMVANTVFDNPFTSLWSARETVLSEEQQEYQQIRLIKKQGFEKINGVRFMVDRFQHRFGTAQHMSDGDLVESLVRGLGMFNQWYPYSNYTPEQFPDSFDTFWIMFSSVWMLQSQRMLLGNLAFNFSGQSITLDYDQTGVIDSAISGMTEWLNTHVTPAKYMLNRQRSLTGVAGVRPARLPGAAYNRVYKIDSNGSGGVQGGVPPNLIGVAQLIGLMP